MPRKSNLNHGKRKPGGQPGNLNAARSVGPAVRRILRGLPLPPELARIVEFTEQEAADLAADKGGLDAMTAGQRALLGQWKMARQVNLLILSELVERGAIHARPDGSWDLQPALTRLAVFLAQERQTLVTLGLERRTKELNLQDYLKSKGKGDGA